MCAEWGRTLQDRCLSPHRNSFLGDQSSVVPPTKSLTRYVLIFVHVQHEPVSDMSEALVPENVPHLLNIVGMDPVEDGDIWIAIYTIETAEASGNLVRRQLGIPLPHPEPVLPIGEGEG